MKLYVKKNRSAPNAWLTLTIFNVEKKKKKNGRNDACHYPRYSFSKIHARFSLDTKLEQDAWKQQENDRCDHDSRSNSVMISLSYGD